MAGTWHDQQLLVRGWFLTNWIQGQVGYTKTPLASLTSLQSYLLAAAAGDLLSTTVQGSIVPNHHNQANTGPEYGDKPWVHACNPLYVKSHMWPETYKCRSHHTLTAFWGLQMSFYSGEGNSNLWPATSLPTPGLLTVGQSVLAPICWKLHMGSSHLYTRARDWGKTQIWSLKREHYLCDG